MITGIITFLLIVAVIGSILYGRRLIKTERIDFVAVRFLKSCKFFMLSIGVDCLSRITNDLNLSSINGWGARIRT